VAGFFLHIDCLIPGWTGCSLDQPSRMVMGLNQPHV